MIGRAKAFFDDYTTQAAWGRRLVFILLIFGGVWLVSVSNRMSVDAKPLMQATALSTNIVISQFRTSGSGGETDEFVELFNPTGGSIDISGWKIKYSDNTGTLFDRCTIPSLSPSLLSGKYYLIANMGFNDGIPIDLNCDLSMADDGGIALTDITDIVIDAVGMSAGAGLKEGTILSPLNSGDDSYLRRPDNAYHGCYDNGDNSVDFIIKTPAQPKNLNDTPVDCASVPPPTETPTSTSTSTSTPTFTATPTVTNTFAPTPVPPMAVIINEVDWAGTAASSNDQWIELYNPGAQPINLAGWHLISSDNSPDILLTGTIPAHDYYLLKIREAAIISTKGTPGPGGNDYAANQLYTGYLSTAGETLRLYSFSGNLVDTANINGGAWDGGSFSPTRGSMERRLGFTDGPHSWITNIGVQRNGLDANGNPINGSPKHANWANLVTPTFTVTPTRTRTPTRPSAPTITRTPTLIKDFVIMNEVLPHATTDYNSDGKVDVGDEYIELINMSNLNVSLQGWLLSDRDPTTGSYAFPPILMSPGERMAFYSSQTGQYLSDGGDIVILIRPGGTAADILTYPVIDQIGKSWCRYPDGIGPWYFGCIPSPNLSNTYQPNPVSTPTPLPNYFSACPLTGVEENVALAECDLPGLDTWDPAQWDAPDFNTLPLYLQNKNSKPVSLE
jgi:hypothetical protein